jgi:N,N'-diacetyllegionaminate synthase
MRERTVIIAEAGVNHNGSINVAKKLIDAAAIAGVDIVKFQTFKAEKIASKLATKAEYQKMTTASNESQLEMLTKLELDENAHDELIAYSGKKGIAFLSTPFDLDSISLLQKKGITIGKIPSGEITNLPYLEAMAAAFPTIILSTGMASIDEVKDAIKVLADNGVQKESLTVLHCNTEYPTPMQDVNLKAMLFLKENLGVSIGYSDHTIGIEVPIAAVALGAKIIEKHITLDRTMEGPDHLTSLEPDELKAMVRAIRNIEMAVAGSGIKEPSLSEQKNIAIARKSIVAAKNLPAGHLLKAEDLAVKRPGNGISPMRFYELIGKTLSKSIDQDELLTEAHFRK